MKLILFFVISCLALHNGNGAPRTAVYKFVKCNPEGDQANCVTQRGPEMSWTPELPNKLPAANAQDLEAEPEEDESPPSEEDVEIVTEENVEGSMTSEEGESPVWIEDGSGAFEGSATEDMLMADLVAVESDTGSGESWAEKGEDLNKGKRDMRQLFPSRSLVGEAKPAEQELTEDHLLQL
ncbi:hypothetical protein PBY51_018845 [Eleginops maclovinus]|uniref:Serglycin n=1 Tax=Eleginops maclovinus TaxID=56733 RepID=A0AAN7YFA2_ELEMC|nr:hypothetical protein PBY51_018845 [Eleginops maclovinus]